MEVDLYPEPNPGISAALTGTQMRQAVEGRAQTAAALYQAIVAKRTGRLAASAHASTEIGGVRSDRWIGVLTVGGQGSRGSVDYAATHEFGRGAEEGAEDLNRILEELHAW